MASRGGIFEFDGDFDESEAEWRDKKQKIRDGNIGTGTISALNLIQSLIIYEGLVIDGLVLINSEGSMAVAKKFPQVIKAMHLEQIDRRHIANNIYQKIAYLNELKRKKPELQIPDNLNAQADGFDLKVFKKGHYLTSSDDHLPRTLFYALLAKDFKIPYSPSPVKMSNS